MIGWSIITSLFLSQISTTIMAHSDASVVPLPSRPNASVNPPVWPIDNAVPAVQTPSAAECTRQDGICCKELIEEERTLVDPDVVRDV